MPNTMIPSVSSVPSNETWVPTHINGLECTATGKLRYTASRTRTRTKGVFLGTPVRGFWPYRGWYIKALQVRDPQKKRMVNVGSVILQAFGKECPEGYEVDHKDHNPCNNSLSNIRFVDRSANLKNRRAYRKSVSKHAWWLLQQKQLLGVVRFNDLPTDVKREYWKMQKKALRSQTQTYKAVA